MVGNPFVSIVVPAYNAEKTIAMNIESLMNLNYPKEKKEVIIIDNDSTDKTREIILRYPVRYILETERGPAAARNTGIKASGGEIIAFTDSDCIVDKNWIAELIQIFDSPRIGGGGGPVIPYKPTTLLGRYWALKGFLQQEAVNGERVYKKPYAITANAFFKKSALEEVGMFNEVDYKLPSGEDAELGWRLSDAGYQLKYVPQSIVSHKYQNTFWDFYQKFYIRGYGLSFGWPGKHCGKKREIIWISTEDYLQLTRLLSKWIANLFSGKDALEKHIPIFDFLSMVAFFTGRLKGNIELLSSK